MPSSSDDDDTSARKLRQRVATLEGELKKARKGMSNAAKKFRAQEKELGDAERLCREQKRTVKSLTAKLASGTVAGGGTGDGSLGLGGKGGKVLSSIVNEDLVNFALSEVFKSVQGELRRQTDSSTGRAFKRIDTVQKFQAATLQVLKASLKSIAKPLVGQLREFAHDHLPAGSTFGGSGSDSDDDMLTSLRSHSHLNSASTSSGSSSPTTTTTTTTSSAQQAGRSFPAASPSSSRGGNAARLPYFPHIEAQRGGSANHVRVTVTSPDAVLRRPMTFTVACTTPFLGSASKGGGVGSRRGARGTSMSSLDALPPVARTVADFEQFAAYLKKEFPHVHVPACLAHSDTSGLVRVSGAAQQNASAEKQARDAQCVFRLPVVPRARGMSSVMFVVRVSPNGR